MLKLTAGYLSWSPQLLAGGSVNTMDSIRGNTPQLALQRVTGMREEVSRLFPASLWVSVKNPGAIRWMRYTSPTCPCTLPGVWLSFKYLEMVNVSHVYILFRTWAVQRKILVRYTTRVILCNKKS